MQTSLVIRYQGCEGLRSPWGRNLYGCFRSYSQLVHSLKSNLWICQILLPLHDRDYFLPSSCLPVIPANRQYRSVSPAVFLHWVPHSQRTPIMRLAYLQHPLPPRHKLHSEPQPLCCLQAGRVQVIRLPLHPAQSEPASAAPILIGEVEGIQ